jgi:hypothetical protein
MVVYRSSIVLDEPANHKDFIADAYLFPFISRYIGRRYSGLGRYQNAAFAVIIAMGNAAMSYRGSNTQSSGEKSKTSVHPSLLFNRIKDACRWQLLCQLVTA